MKVKTDNNAKSNRSLIKPTGLTASKFVPNKGPENNEEDAWANVKMKSTVSQEPICSTTARATKREANGMGYTNVEEMYKSMKIANRMPMTS